MSWQTRPSYQYPAGDGTFCEEPSFIPEWAEQPSGYVPWLPLMSSVSLMPPLGVIQPVLGTYVLGQFVLGAPAPSAIGLLTVGGKLPPHMDPMVGGFVQDHPLPPGLDLAPLLQLDYLPIDTPALEVGETVIGDRSAVGILPPPAFHGEQR